jgi:hypothetical protein
LGAQLWGPHFITICGGPLKGTSFKEGLHKMGPCFYERQKIELFPQNLINLGPQFEGTQPPTLSHFVGVLFEWGPPLKGLPLKEGPNKMEPCF